jgi:protein-tyrosine-phosphatase
MEYGRTVRGQFAQEGDPVTVMSTTPSQISEADLPFSYEPTHPHPAPRHDRSVEDHLLHLRFVCPADPSRAFIAEAFVRALARDGVDGWAKGDPARVDPAARRVMDEIGTPLRTDGASASGAGDDSSEEVVVIRNRGVPPLSDVISWSFDDPSESEDEATRLSVFRRVRDEIKRRVDLLVLVMVRALSLPEIPQRGNS